MPLLAEVGERVVLGFTLSRRGAGAGEVGEGNLRSVPDSRCAGPFSVGARPEMFEQCVRAYVGAGNEAV